MLAEFLGGCVYQLSKDDSAVGSRQPKFCLRGRGKLLLANAGAEPQQGNARIV